MKSMDLLETIGSIRDKYILEAENAGEQVAPARKAKAVGVVRLGVAAMIALVLAGMLFLQTPMGVAAVEIVKESVSKLIETLFPPRDIIVIPEGTPEVVHHEAQGRDPEEDAPGFVMYVDTESYEMTEENGIYYVRPIPVEYDREEIRRQQASVLEGLSPEEQEAAIDARIQELQSFYGSLPANEIEIREVPDREFSAYTEEVRNQMSADWEITEDLIWTDKPLAFTFRVSGGKEWDSPCEIHYFVDNRGQGTFHIVARYYQEATEGHGSRFVSMIQTFEAVTREDTAQYQGAEDDVRETMVKIVDAAIEQNAILLQAADSDSKSPSDLQDIAVQRYTLWLETLDQLWPALEEKLDPETMQDLLASRWEWSAWKAEVQDQAVAEVSDDFSSAAVFYGTGAEMLEHSVYYALNILEDTAPILPRDPSVSVFPEAVISQFVKAYYAGDKEALGQYLSESYSGDIDVYSDLEPADPEINAIKGLENIVHDMADRGVIQPAIQFRKKPDSDYYMYLSMTLTWEDSQWKVMGYGLEG